MKHSNTWFALILIASALLPSVGPSASAQSLGPSQSLTQQGNNAPQDNQSYSGKWTGTWTANSDNGKPSPKKSGENSDQNTGWLGKISAQGFFNFITAVATGVIAWYTVKLTGVTGEMKKATTDAAQASKDSAIAAKASADAAERALHLDRPYLLSGTVELKNFQSESKRVLATFTIKNWGTRPAFISEIRARLGITSVDPGIPGASDGTPAPIWRKREPSKFPQDLVDHGWAIRLENDVIEPNQASPSCQTALAIDTNELEEDQLTTIIRLGHLPDDLFQRLTESGFNDKHGPMPDIQITLKGIVRYHDAALTNYWTEFCWDFSANLIQFHDVGRFDNPRHRHGEDRRSAPAG